MKRMLLMGLAVAITFVAGIWMARDDPRVQLLVASGTLLGLATEVGSEDRGAGSIDSEVSSAGVELSTGASTDDSSASIPGTGAASTVEPRSDGTVDDSLPRPSGPDDLVDGVKLRGDGTVDDNLPRHSGLDDLVDGVKLRGDGTVDDNLPRHSGLDDAVAGVKLRGDGTVDDNSASRGDDSGRNRGSRDRDDDRSGGNRGRR